MNKKSNADMDRRIGDEVDRAVLDALAKEDVTDEHLVAAQYRYDQLLRRPCTSSHPAAARLKIRRALTACGYPPRDKDTALHTAEFRDFMESVNDLNERSELCPDP